MQVTETRLGMVLSTARIFVRDLSAAETFYRGKLQLPLQAGGVSAGYCVFQTGYVQLVVEEVPMDAPHDEQVLVGRFTGLSFTVANIGQTHQELAACGVVFSGVPEKQPWGGVLATFQDPAGNELQLVQVRGTD
jgi:catechol 2,3-dioxygenase-like lactoylglutathione lyase family enzyme